MQNTYGDQPTEIILYVFSSFALLTLIWKLSARFGYNRSYITLIFVGLNLFGLATYLYGGAYFLSTDGATYVRQAEDIIVWFQDSSHTFQITRWKFFWPSLIALVYFVCGKVPLLIILINVTLVTLSSIFVYKTAVVFSKFQPNWSFVALFLVNPIILLFAISTGREAVFWLALSVIVLGVSYLLERNYKSGVVIFLSGAALGALSRPTLSLPIIYFLIISTVLIIGFRVSVRSKLRKMISVVLSVVIGLTALPFIPLLKEDTERVPIVREALSRTATTSIQDVSPKIPIAHSAEANNDIIPSAFTNLYNSIANLLKAAFGPFPQEMSPDFVWVVLGITNCWWIMFLVLCVIGIKNKYRNPLAIVLLSAALFTFAILAWTLTNYGILFRFRGAVMYLLLPFAVIGISRLKDKIFAKETFKNIST